MLLDRLPHVPDVPEILDAVALIPVKMAAEPGYRRECEHAKNSKINDKRPQAIDKKPAPKQVGAGKITAGKGND